MKRKLISFLLLAAMLFSTALTGCSEQAQDGAESDVRAAETPDAAPSAETEAPAEEEVHDDLGVYDYEGASFGMMTFENENFHYEMLAEEMTAVTLNDAEYEATMKIQERFNVDLVQTLYPDSSNTPRVSVTAGDNTVDLIRLRCTEAVSWWTEHLLVEADKVPMIDMTKPYWDKTVNDSIRVANRHYVALSAYDLCTYDLTFALMFNKSFITDFNLPNPYELVLNQEWTMDKMNEMMLTVVSDTDGNGTFDKNDRYGYLAHPKMVAPGFWIGADVKSVAKDENDMPYLNIGSEEFIQVWEKLLSLCYSDNQYFGVNEGADIPPTARLMFSEDKSLFMDMSFYFAEELRTMESDFGILPYPKFNAEQENYRSRLCYYMPTIVPITKVDSELERCGVILEALGCEYFKNVIPAYYNVVLQYKVSRDEESQEMLDIVFNTRVIDIGDSTLCGDIRDAILRTMFENNYVEVASRAKSLEKIVASKLNNIPDAEE